VSPASPKPPASSLAPVLLRIEGRILVLCGLNAMIDVDLATLYGVPTRRLNEQVKRNRDWFPGDFMFQLDAAERAEVVANCDHLAKLKFSKALPYAFTEHGAVQAANVLASPQAVEMRIYVVRAFVRMRELAGMHADLAKRLDALEQKTEGLALTQDAFSRNTRNLLIEAVNQLMVPPDPPKRPIGFVTPEDKAAKRCSGAVVGLSERPRRSSAGPAARCCADRHRCAGPSAGCPGAAPGTGRNRTSPGRLPAGSNRPHPRWCGPRPPWRCRCCRRVRAGRCRRALPFDAARGGQTASTAASPSPVVIGAGTTTGKPMTASCPGP
jgi:ORF6N domain